MITNGPTKTSLVINSKNKWCRRALLSRIGKTSAAAALMPFVPIMEAGAQSNRAVRYVQWYHANGSSDTSGYWQDKSGPINTPNGSPYKPFDAHQEDVAFIGNMHLRSAQALKPINPHNQPAWAAISGDDRNLGSDNYFTLDQIIANHLKASGVNTSYRNFVMGFKNNNNNDLSVSVNNGNLAAGDRDPRVVYDRLFKTALSINGVPEGQQLNAQKKSILDFVGDSIKKLKPIISEQDRNKLDFHLNAIREVEERISLVEDSMGCNAFDDVDKMAQAPAEKFGNEIVDAYIDLIVASFTCDLTRVVSFQMSFGHDFHSYEWLGLSGDFHGWTHNRAEFKGDGIGQVAALARLNQAMTWRHQKIVRLIDKLKAVQEPGGTLLDNTGILAWTETSRLHDYDNAMWVLAGGMGGKIKTGHYTDYNGADHNKLLTTIAQAMGMNTNRIGSNNYQAGTLDGLLKV